MDTSYKQAIALYRESINTLIVRRRLLQNELNRHKELLSDYQNSARSYVLNQLPDIEVELHEGDELIQIEAFRAYCIFKSGAYWQDVNEPVYVCELEGDYVTIASHKEGDTMSGVIEGGFPIKLIQHMRKAYIENEQ